MTTESPRQILLLPKESMDAAGVAALAEIGIVVVQVDDPSKAVLLMPSAPLVSGNDMLIAMMEGLRASGSSTGFAAMFGELQRRIKNNEARSLLP